MKILKAVDIIILILASAGAILISVIHVLELFPSVEAITHIDYPLLTLVLLALVGIHLGASHFAAEHFRESANERLDLISARVNSSLVHIFENSIDLEKYLARRIREAHTEVCDLSWKKRISAGFDVGKRKGSHKSYEASVDAAAKSILYREIFIFNDMRRIEKLKRRVSEAREGYSCRHYEEDGTIPRMQFVIIDSKEIVFFAISSNSLLCAIESTELCGVFKPYFEEAWNGAIPIKDGPVLHQAEYDRILARIGSGVRQSTIGANR